MSKRRSKSKGVLAFLFCLPLVFIIYFAVIYTSQSISLDNVNKVTVSVPDAEDVVFESVEDIDFYVNMLTGSLSINTAMRDVSGEEPVYIICNREDRTVEYKLYPSLNLSGCLLVAPEGKLYVLENETAKSLLLRSEFDYLYTSYFLPKLNVVSGENSSEILPTESTWNYFKSDGVSYSYTPPAYATGEETYTILKGLENTLRFTPDNESMPCQLSDISYVSENGNTYNIKDVSELDLSVDTVITVSFTAKWSSVGGAQASGEAKYKFNILYDIPATVELSEKEFTAGDVIVINAANLNSDEVVTLDTLLNVPLIDFDVINDDEGIALLPIGLDNPEGSYTVKLNTGVGSVSETVTVTAKDSGEWTPISVTTEQYDEMLSLAKLAEFEQTLASVTANRTGVNHFVYGESALHSPVGSVTPEYEFGQMINLGVSDISGDSGQRTCEGVVYELDEGTSVRSAQAGEVVFSGNLAPTGNTVVVYHGYGIYTYYYHLDTVNVREGYTLTDGEILGTAGKTGFTNDKTVLHYAVSIDGVFVDPMWFS